MDGIPIWDEMLDNDNQCNRCARSNECNAVWKNPDAQWVTCVGFQRKKTNADRIRAMSDEELAEWLAKNDPECDPPEWWLDWLKQEAEE